MEGRSLKDFGISRVVRLYPAYWFSIIVTFLAMSYWVSDSYPYSSLDALVNMSMLQSWFHVPNICGVYWTLAIELQFYLMVAVVLVLRLSRRFSLLLGIWLAISVLAYYVKMPILIKHIFLVSWSHYFIAGACFYLILRDGNSLYKLVLTGVSLFQAMKLGYWYAGLKERLTGVEFDAVAVILAIAVFYGFFYLVALRKISDCFHTLAKLGVLTYPLYLIHSVGEIALKAYLPVVNRYVLLCLTTIVCIGIAYAIHRFIEKPFSPILKAFLIRRGATPDHDWERSGK